MFTGRPASNFTRKSPNCPNCPTFGLVKSLAGDRKRERERERYRFVGYAPVLDTPVCLGNPLHALFAFCLLMLFFNVLNVCLLVLPCVITYFDLAIFGFHVKGELVQQKSAIVDDDG